MNKASQKQIHPSLSIETYKKFKKFCQTRGLTGGAVADAAIKAYFDETNDKALVLDRLNKLARSQKLLKRNMDSMAEALGVYIRYWFAHTPQLSESQRSAAGQSSKKRYAKFCEDVANSLTSGHRFVNDLFEEEIADDQELANAAGTSTR